MNPKQRALCIFFSLLVTPCFVQAQDAVQKMSKKEIKVLIDSLGSTLDRWYIYPDKAAQMTKAVEKNYTRGAYNNVADKAELSRQLNDDLQQAYTDRHMQLVYHPQMATDIETPRNDTAANRRAYEMDLLNARENNFAFKKAEILQGNIGYLRWDGFWGFVDEALPTLDAAFKFVSNCRALIIDMRYNYGGAPPMVLQTQSYFFNEKTRMNDIIDRNNDTLKRWADPAITSFKLNMPVYILTSQGTFSGAEDFTYGLQCVKRAVVVGDTTGGGAHPTRPFSIGQGFVVHIPTHRSPNIVTGTDWDGTGIWPDVPVSSAHALEKAQALIFTEFLSHATDQREKEMWQWQLTSMDNKARLVNQLQKNDIKITTEALHKFCGEYNPADPTTSSMTLFIIPKGDYIYRHLSNGAQDIRLIPVDANKFVYDDESGRAIHFVTSKDGTVSHLLFYRQGGVFKHIRK